MGKMIVPNCHSDFDAILGNPPFIRSQYLDSYLQARSGKNFSKTDLAFTKHTNAWVPFIIASLAMASSSVAGWRWWAVRTSARHSRAIVCRHSCSKNVHAFSSSTPKTSGLNDTSARGRNYDGREACRKATRQRRKSLITAVRGREALQRPAHEYFETADFFSGGDPETAKWMLAS